MSSSPLTAAATVPRTNFLGLVAVLIPTAAFLANQPTSSALDLSMYVSLLLYAAVTLIFPLTNMIRIPLIVSFLRLFAVPFFLKPIIGQPLTDHFNDPNGTALAVFIGTISLSIVYVIASLLFRYRSQVKASAVQDLEIAYAGFILLGIGTAAFVMSVLFERSALLLDPTASTPFAQFRNAIFVGSSLIFLTQARRFGWGCLKRHVVWAVLGFVVLVALLGNGRSYIGYVALTLIFSLIMAGLKIRLRTVLVAATMGFTLLMLITPAFMVVREAYSSRKTESPVAVVAEVFQEWLVNPAAIAAKYRDSDAGWQITIYRPIWDVYGNFTVHPIQRVSHIGVVDALLSRYQLYEKLGFKTIGIAIADVTPRLFGAKHIIPVGDYIYWNGGLEQQNIPGYQTATPIGEGAATFGYIGIFFFPIAILSLLLVSLKAVDTWLPTALPFAVTILFNPMAEADTQIALDMCLRQIPLMIVLYLLVRLAMKSFVSAAVSTAGHVPRGARPHVLARRAETGAEE